MIGNPFPIHRVRSGYHGATGLSHKLPRCPYRSLNRLLYRRRCEHGNTYDGYSVTAKTWLAPFDLGYQPAIYHQGATDRRESHLQHSYFDAHLLSGQRSAWRRVTIPFLRELRQQFLVWRTLDDETTDRYRALGGDEDAAERIEERKKAVEA